MSTWSDLRRLVRSRTSDPHGVFASDQELVDYFITAEEEACRQGVYRTSATVTLVAGTPNYAYPTGLLEPSTVIWGGRSTPLAKKSRLYMAERSPAWMSATGDPIVYLTDVVSDELWFYPSPVAATITESPTVTIYGKFLPTTTLTEATLNDNSTTPDIPAQYHQELVSFVVGMVLTKDGRSEEQKKNGEKALAMFNQALGKMSWQVAQQDHSERPFTYLHGRFHSTRRGEPSW